MAGSPTALAKLAFGDADPVDFALNFASFDPGVSREIRNTKGSTGTFIDYDNRIREARRVVTPRYSGEPTALEWSKFLPWIFSGTPTGSGNVTYPPSNSAALKYMYFKPVTGTEVFMSSVAVDTATIRATAGEPLGLDLDLVGITADETRSDYPSLTPDNAYQPFMLSDLILTFNGGAVKPRSFTLTIACGIDRTRFNASLTLTAILKLAMRYNISFEVPAGDNAALHYAGITAAVACTAVLTNPVSGATFTFTIPKVRFPSQYPNYQLNQEGWTAISGICLGNGNGIGSGNAPITTVLNIGT